MMDCGPAFLKMLAKFYGKYYSLQYLRDKCGITKEGISFLDMSHAAEEIGLRTLSLKSTISDLMYKIPLPVIIHWDNSHFVVVYKAEGKRNKEQGTNSKAEDSQTLGDTKHQENQKTNTPQIKGTIYVSDPAKGYVKYNTQKFAKKWLNDDGEKGTLMAIEPQAEFYQKQANKK